MKYQNLFSGRKKKNISISRLLKILPRVLSVKHINIFRYTLCPKICCDDVKDDDFLFSKVA